jgi:glycosyltransferase involved in cell wall biosynthesis
MKRLKIMIWHVHGSYLYYLTQAPHEFYLPSKTDRKGYYSGKWGHLPWGENVHDVPAEKVKNLDFDCIIFQQPAQFYEDQYRILSAEQQKLPKIYLEHDPPQQHPTDTKHFIDDPNVLLVHVTAFNNLMWDAGQTPTTVIDHGVLIPPNVSYKGDLDKGIVIINHLKDRGRRLGSDIYANVHKKVPLDLVGMASEELEGGVGEVIHKDLFEFISRYRFFFQPIRYTSLSLSLCESMMIGLPIIALATTELVTVIKNGISGYIDTRIERLIEFMNFLIKHPDDAKRLGIAARRYALERFNIERFIDDWNKALAQVTGFSQTWSSTRANEEVIR